MDKLNCIEEVNLEKSVGEMSENEEEKSEKEELNGGNL